MSGSNRGTSDSALREAQRIRSAWIDFSYALPDPATPEVLRLWGEADIAMSKLIDALARAAR